nr:put. S3a ribosomal protein homologue [Anopheles gambiae]
MAVGKNKGVSKGGKKGSKKKVVDPFTRKDWYDVKAPNMFKNRQSGKTLVNRTQGTKIASDGLKGRVFEVSLADLQNEPDAERSFRKFKLVAESVNGRDVLTNFHGMALTTDKLRSMVNKWQTLIECSVDVKTTDGFMLRVFCIGFTIKDSMSQRKTCYAQHSQIKNIRAKMTAIIKREITSTDLKGVVEKLLPDSIAKDIEKACQVVYPLHDVYIRKVKVLKKPRFDLSSLMELHGDGGGKAAEVSTGAASGVVVVRPEGYEPPVQASV